MSLTSGRCRHVFFVVASVGFGSAILIDAGRLQATKFTVSWSEKGQDWAPLTTPSAGARAGAPRARTRGKKTSSREDHGDTGHTQGIATDRRQNNPQ